MSPTPNGPTIPPAPGAPKPRSDVKGLHAIMTAQLAFRQFGLLFLAATAYFLCWIFFNFYGLTNFGSLWGWGQENALQWKFLSINTFLFVIFAFILLNGFLFSLGPSERSFNVFFGIMVLALLVVHYDHTIIDWFLNAASGGKLRVDPDKYRPVNAFKILFSGLFFLVLIVMHYNVLTDDFARRLIRRGIPTKEVFPVRRNMFKVLVPVVLTASAIAFGLALLGHLGALIFQTGGLFAPKLQLIILAVLIVPMAFLLRGILRDLAASKGKAPPAGPNR